MRPRWDPSPVWSGEDSYVVGGGPSLLNFDWGLIRGRNTIGCNSAFVLGADIIKVCIFADFAWWEKIGRDQLPEYGGIVVASCPSLEREDLPNWVLFMDREEKRGLARLGKLSFNGNTGSLALHLALMLGAKRVFLLGFDMKLSGDQKANWHDLRYQKANGTIYKRFIAGFQAVARDLPGVYPGCEVWNVTNDSDLDCFPKVSPEVHFGRSVNKEVLV